MEVFPALALASLDPRFFGRLSGPGYNPARKKTFRASDWTHVAQVTAQAFAQLGCCEPAGWCRNAGTISGPRKADQDKMDAALCVLVALRWRLLSRDGSLMIGNLDTGYMVTPSSEEVRARLVVLARMHSYQSTVYIPLKTFLNQRRSYPLP